MKTLSLILTLCVAAPASAALKAGAFAIDITPAKFPISVNGGMTDRQATGSHDRLHARCIVLDDGRTEIAIVVVDSCMIPRSVMDSAKALASDVTGIPTDKMLIAATHTHTAPAVAGVFQSDPDEAYQKLLAGRIAEGIRRAHRNLEPAELGYATAENAIQVFNRRWLMKPGSIAADPFGGSTDKVKMNPGYKAAGLVKPAGPIDPTVSVLSLQTRGGDPIALLGNYSLHYVGGIPPLSADYFGAFAERIEELIPGAKSKRDPEFVGVMSNGTSGDINNIDYSGDSPGKREPGEQVRLVADSVAKTALEAYRKIEHRQDVTIDMMEKEITLGVRKPTAEEVDRARAILKKAEGRPLKGYAEYYARETVKLGDYPTDVSVKLQAIRIGDLGIAAIPCEVFAEIGLELKKKSGLKDTFTIELANGYNGYLPTPAQHKLGGYETWRARSSYLEAGASPKIVNTLEELFKGVTRR